MRILSLEQSTKVFNCEDLGSFFSGVDWQYPDPIPSYFLPKDSGAKVGLARWIADVFTQRGPTALWITQIGIWPSSEHMDLFTGYRLGHGERRTAFEAPVHVFDSKEDRDAFISILCVCLFFIWEVEIINVDRSLAVTVSHDEWLEYRFAPGQERLISIFEEHLRPFAAGDLQR